MVKVIVLALIVIRSFAEGLAGVHSANPEMKLSVTPESAVGDGPVLAIEYPAASGNPASRDVWCEAEHVDWTAGQAIAFQAKPDHAMRLSVSFMDRNRVAYTSWADLRAGEWQTVRIPFAQIKPNPYFQPPGAKTGAPLDVSEVKAIGFAPQDPAAGRIQISRFTIVD